MECSKKCLRCQNPKKSYVNYSRFHGACENEIFDSYHIICIHCKSVVPILISELINSSSTSTNILGSQEHLELKDFIIPSPKKTPYMHFVINKEQINTISKKPLELALSRLQAFHPGVSKQEKLLTSDGNKVNPKLILKTETLDLSLAESDFEEFHPNAIKRDDSVKEQESGCCSEILQERKVLDISEEEYKFEKNLQNTVKIDDSVKKMEFSSYSDNYNKIKPLDESHTGGCFEESFTKTIKDDDPAIELELSKSSKKLKENEFYDKENNYSSTIPNSKTLPRKLYDNTCEITVVEEDKNDQEVEPKKSNIYFMILAVVIFLSLFFFIQIIWLFLS